MGAAAAPVAAVSSLASLGLSFAGGMDKATADIMKGEAVNAQDQYQADQAEEAARFGRLQAGLTDVTMRENLTKTISSIDAMRAAGNVDPSSPTTATIEDWNRMLSDRQRTAAVVTARSQAAMEDASAAYLRQAGQFAMTTAGMSASADKMAAYAGLLGGIGKMAGGMGGFGGGVGAGDPSG